MNTKILFWTVCIFGFLSGCLTDPGEDIPRHVDIYLQIHNLGETIERGNNTLEIEEFKFIVRKFHLVAIDSIVIESADDIGTLVFAYRQSFQGDRLVLSVPLGFIDFDIFEGFTLFVNRVRDFDIVLDPDFFGDPENFSVVIKGEYNNQMFTLKLSDEFDEHYLFNPPVALSNEKETLFIRTRLDVKDVFIDPSDDTIIDPLDEDNYAIIFSLFRNSIRIEPSAVNMLF